MNNQITLDENIRFRLDVEMFPPWTSAGLSHGSVLEESLHLNGFRWVESHRLSVDGVDR
jgi:hypothetical protein